MVSRFWWWAVNRTRVISLLVAIAVSSSLTALPVSASGDHKRMHASIVVNADPEVVWEVIKKTRSNERRKIVKSLDNEVTIEEKFDGLPVIGRALCTYKEVDVPCKRIDYALVHSDRFRAFEGTWELSPADHGKHTILQLSTYLDTGVNVPFAREITNHNVIKDIKRRLGDVKSLAEGPGSTAAEPTHHHKHVLQSQAPANDSRT